MKTLKKLLRKLIIWILVENDTIEFNHFVNSNKSISVDGSIIAGGTILVKGSVIAQGDIASYATSKQVDANNQENIKK